MALRSLRRPTKPYVSTLHYLDSRYGRPISLHLPSTRSPAQWRALAAESSPAPLDVIKTKLQAQGSFANPGLRHPGPSTATLYRGMIGTAKTIVRQDGLKGMYRGLGPMLLGYLPTWAVYMAVYDSSREWYHKHNFGTSDGEKWLPRIYASVTAGACSTLVTNPIWVIKTRLMSQISSSDKAGVRTPWYYNNTLDAARQMYRHEGMAAFYSGLAPALLGLTHVAIQFPLYEYFKQRLTGVEMGEIAAADAGQWTHIGGILAATLLSKVCATSATYPHEVLRTRLQTQQRFSQPEHSHHGLVTSSHASHSTASPPDRLRYTNSQLTTLHRNCPSMSDNLARRRLASILQRHGHEHDPRRTCGHDDDADIREHQRRHRSSARRRKRDPSTRKWRFEDVASPQDRWMFRYFYAQDGEVRPRYHLIRYRNQDFGRTPDGIEAILCLASAAYRCQYDLHGFRRKAMREQQYGRRLF